ncbi:MAG: Mur ligase family protein [Candidatus Levybacteria bacterium]|nr:Mur ligase family protein [Candidatus Levybacteria bacterium]
MSKIKDLLYFPIAYYFKFWAQIQLFLWKPRIVAVTGSSGKTTLLHLIQAQLGNKAKYSHHANSSYGIPFDILGLSRKNLTLDEWPYLFLLAPLKAFKKVPQEKIYIVEADCDRPGEGKFLASLLRPEITLWINVSLTHSANFDHLALQDQVLEAQEAIANEFGYFPQYTKKLVIANGDSPLIAKQLKRTKATIEQIIEKSLNDYKLFADRTEFYIDKEKYSINYIVPKDVFYSIAMTKLLMETLDISFNPSFPNLFLPPGRSSIFKGIKNTILIDSTYNSTPVATRLMLDLFNLYPAENKWIVLGDMIELGNEEQREHEKLADLINSMTLDKIILIGPRVSRYTYPKLNSKIIQKAEKFIMPKEGSDHILKHIKGDEVMFFKGARFLEGIVEHLLKNKDDAKKLVRREKAWQNRRKAWGL